MFLRKYWLSAAVGVLLTAGAAQAALPQNYPETFSELSGLIDGDTPGPLEMMRGGWLATRYFFPAAEGLSFNRERFATAHTAGEAALSGLFLGVNGTPGHHQFIRKELETNRAKRIWMSRIFGTEAVFFQGLENGEGYRPLLEVLPSTNGLRALLRILQQSSDSLVRRAGLFWGYWLADGDYWMTVREIAAKDPDAVNRTCAVRLMRRPGR